MRAMVLEFPADRTCAFLDRQYMLGPDLLVAPVFSDDGDVDVYVPAGEWTSYWDGSRVAGLVGCGSDTASTRCRCSCVRGR